MGTKPGRNSRVGNNRALKHGLSRRLLPPRVVNLPAADVDALAGYARDMAGAALWLAEELATWPGKIAMHHAENSIHNLVGLFAEVAQEMAQLAARLEGAEGIRPANLGALPQEKYEALVKQQRDALELVLSQVVQAVAYLRANDPVGQDGSGTSTLRLLARTMRRAGRIMADLAANYAWQRAQAEGEDLAARILAVIDAERPAKAQEEADQ